MSATRITCDHGESLYGRCVACGMTWEQQAGARKGPDEKCPKCEHAWPEHDKSDGCFHGWEYNLDGIAVTEGCECPLAHVRKSA